MWPRQSGKWFDLSELLGTHALLPFNKIEGFNYLETTNYQGTLFRFPLRNRPSDLSRSTHDAKTIIKLTAVLRDEAKFLLLFLRSVHTVVLSSITSKGICNELFHVQVTPDCQGKLTKQRTKLKTKVSDIHKSSPYRISPCISCVSRFSIELKDTINQQSRTMPWLIASRVGSTNVEVLKTSEQQETFPWVGVAMQLDEHSASDGRVFCFLPMPVEASSNLPVHVNGTFGLNDDRRTIKWPGGERRNDPTAHWNQILVKDCLPTCYSLLLKNAVRDNLITSCLLYTSPSPRDATLSRMPSSA